MASIPPRRAIDPPRVTRSAHPRDASTLHITLARPHMRDTLNAAIRDQLVEAFLLAALDDTITEIHLCGDGASFCSGGDLDEFGSFPDPATAHLIRLQQSVGRAIDSGRTAGHGPPARRLCRVGHRAAGLRWHGSRGCHHHHLPARGVARADPRRGGTVSLPARIGRHRTARLALTGESIDAATALAWGLVDALAPSSSRGAAQPGGSNRSVLATTSWATSVRSRSLPNAYARSRMSA